MNEQLEKGKVLINEGKIQEALNCFEVLVESNPTNHLAVYYVGLCHLKLDNVASSILHFNRALDLAPNTVIYLSDRAVAKLRAKDQHGSLADLDKCVELEPNYSYRYSLRAFIKNSFGDVEGAITDYKKAVELDPEDSIALNNLGMCEEAQGYKSSAQRRFEAADKLSGVAEEGRNHTIELNKSSENEESQELKMQNQTYWSTIRSVFTDSKQREEFFKFTSDLFKGKPKN